MNNRIIDDNQLEDVSGGVVLENSVGQWEVIDNEGNVRLTSQSYDEAVKFAQENEYSIGKIGFRRY